MRAGRDAQPAGGRRAAEACRAGAPPPLARTPARAPPPRAARRAPRLHARYNDDLELEDAVHTALLTLKEGFEGAMDHNNIEVGVVGADKSFKVLSPAEIKDYLGEVE